MKKITAIIASALLVLASCKKDKHDGDVTKENLTGTYKLAALVSKTGNQPQEDEYAQMDACEKDDLVKFNADNTFNAVDAGTVCTPNGNDNGTWSLPSASQLTIMGQTHTIKSFNGRTLVLEYTTGSGNNTYTLTTTLAKQ
jgi:hypothetical protein